MSIGKNTVQHWVGEGYNGQKQHAGQKMQGAQCPYSRIGEGHASAHQVSDGQCHHKNSDHRTPYVDAATERGRENASAQYLEAHDHETRPARDREDGRGSHRVCRAVPRRLLRVLQQMKELSRLAG